MKSSTCRASFQWCSLTIVKVCMLILTSTFAEACENSLNLEYCIDPVIYKAHWTSKNNEMCGSKPGTVIHCQKMSNGLICSMCASSKICDRGTRARLDTLTKTVSCVRCDKDWFQDTERDSYLFRTPSCGSQHMACSDGKIICSEGTATEDNKCLCDYEVGYKPYGPDCLCFDHHSSCGCKKANCPGKVDSNYECIPVTTTVKPETTETTTIIAVIGETSDQESHGLANWAIAAIVIPIVLIIVLTGIGIRCCCWDNFKKKIKGVRCCCKGSKTDKNGTELSPMMENGMTPCSEINPESASNGTSHRTEEMLSSNGAPIEGRDPGHIVPSIIVDPKGAKEKHPIVTTEETNDVTSKMVTAHADGDLVREAAQQKVNEQKLKNELLNKPTKVVQSFHAAGNLNMVVGDHGIIYKTVESAGHDLSSLDDDSEDDLPLNTRRNEQEPRNNLTEDGDQQTTNQRQGEQHTENHLEENENFDMEETMVKTVDPQQTMVKTVDPQQTMVKTVDPQQTMVKTVDPQQTMVKTVDPQQTMVKTVDPQQTMVKTVDPQQTMVKTVDPQQTMVKTVDPQQTMVKTVDPQQTVVKTVEIV